MPFLSFLCCLVLIRELIRQALPPNSTTFFGEQKVVFFIYVCNLDGVDLIHLRFLSAEIRRVETRFEKLD